MKKKVFSLLAVFCLACVLTLSACGGKKDKVPTTDRLSLDDYAVSIAEAREQGLIAGTYKGYTSAVKQGEWTDTNVYSNSPYIEYTEKDSTRVMYNYVKDRVLAQGYSGAAVRVSEGCIEIFESYSPQSRSLYTLDGTAILEHCRYLSIVTDDIDEMTDDEKVVCAVRYSKENSYADSVMYLGLDKNGNAYEIKPSSSSFETSNGVINEKTKITLNDLCDYEENYYTEDDQTLKDFSIYRTRNASLGCTYEFVKGGKTTSLTLSRNADSVCYADGKLLYAVTEMLPYDADDYNVILFYPGEGEYTSKARVAFHSFDIASGKDSKLNLGYVSYSDFVPLYNYKTKKYDAYAVTAVNNCGGVATLSVTADLHYYIVDASGKVAYETNGFNPSTIIRLKSDRYLVKTNDGARIIDGKCQTVADVNSSFGIVESANAVIARAEYSYGSYFYGAVDYDGKIVLPLKYYNYPQFYGGMAYVNTTENGERNIPKLLSASDWKEYDVKSLLKLSDSATVTKGDIDGTIIVTDYEAKNRYSLYNYAGQMLIDNLGSNSLYKVASYDNVQIIRVYNNNTYSYEYYVIK